MLNADLIFFTDSSMNIGGQELQALQQMHSLNHVGFECILLCKPHSAISKRARDQGITLHEIPFRNAFHIPSFRQILRTIREKKPTAIICHGSHDALICAFAAKWISLFFAVHIAVYRVKTFQHGHPLSFAYNYLFTKTLTPSSYLRSLFLVNPMINPHKINVLYPGIDFSRLGNSGDSLPNHALEWLASHPGPVIAHGAILRGEKGHRVILKALVEVKKKFPTIRYLMAGEGQEREEGGPQGQGEDHYRVGDQAARR
jgi:glycosyltransferase involved in cell wall biosynthesis